MASRGRAKLKTAIAASACLFFSPTLSSRAETPQAPSDVVARALVDELERSMKELKLGELPPPYLIQLNAQDRWSFTMNAAYGGITGKAEQRNRFLSSRVRIGAYELDNTNFGQPFGNAGRLPLDDDYLALRHAVWSILDEDYKRAVETLTAKIAYLRDHTIDDRPHDYTPGQPIIHTEPRARLDIDRTMWARRLETLSARFLKHPRIQNAKVSFIAATADHWIINSEGTRLRTGDTGILLQVEASLQADDGMPLSDGRSYLGLTADDLPSERTMLDDIDAMCRKLTALADAPLLDHYTGPVLFEPVPAGQAFEALLGHRFCARPIPIGSGWEDDSFENRIGLRILPRSFTVYDDPLTERYEGVVLAGAYRFDDEGTPARRVQLVSKGVLKTLLSGRAPTRKIKQSNGHARNLGFGDAWANVGVLYIEDQDGLTADELRRELIVAAEEEGLEYALRVERTHNGDYETLGDPIYVYRVFTDDGREELLRGLTFLPVTPRAWKRLLAAGRERRVYNSISDVSSSYITPAVLFEELDLAKTKQEFARPPILPSPFQRTKDPS